MAAFLSPEWLQELADAAAVLDGLDPDVRLTVEQVVDDVRWSMRLAGGRLSVVPGAADDADVRLTTDRSTAAAVARGELAAADAVAAGRLRIGGDLSALLRAAPALAGLDAAFAAVRERTTY